MPRMSGHSKERSKQRVEGVESVSDAKECAKQAWHHGRTINQYISYPKFFSYLQNKKGQTRTCSLRIYKDNIYIWRGKLRTLVTVHPIPDRYKKEMEEVNTSNQCKKEGISDVSVL